MEALYRAEVFIAAACFLVSALVFSFTPWHRSMAGKGLFIVLWNFAIILCLIVTSFWLGDYPAREFVRTLLYTLTMINGVLSVIFVISQQIIGYKKSEVNNYGRRFDDYPRNRISDKGN